MSGYLDRDVPEDAHDTQARSFIEAVAEELVIGDHLDRLIPTNGTSGPEGSTHDWGRRKRRIYLCRRLVSRIIHAYEEDKSVYSQLLYIEEMHELRKARESQHDAECRKA